MKTRREFIGMTAAAAAGLAGTGSAAAQTPAGGPSGDIDVWITSAAAKYSKQSPLRWQPFTARPPDAIALDPTRAYQELLGFGASFTDSACYTINRLDPAAREKLLHELLDPSEMGMSVSRICIGASDYAVKQYSFDDSTEPDPELRKFSIDHDKEYILPILRQARKINPDLYLLASPWSPPGWVKSNGSMLGGSMREKYMGPYANYFVEFLQAYAAEGVPVDAVSVQNEVDADQDGRMPACTWAQEVEMTFVSRHLGPAFETNNIKTKIWILDHNYNLWGRAVAQLEDARVRRYVDGVAFHGYAGRPESMTRVHDLYPDKNIYWTEGGPDVRTNYATEWPNWGRNFAGALRNWARCMIGWNMALDEKGNPKIGPFFCGGVVTVDSQTREITRSGQYWAFLHYSRAFRRGARRFDSEGVVEGVSHVAFDNTDGTKAIVLTNSGAARTVRLALGDVTTQVDLPERSLATLSWR